MKNNVRFFGVSLMMTFVTVPKRRRRRGEKYGVKEHG